ncbi:hypothetical protein DN92_03255 [Polynucleobacter arcticus]|uniref:Uncharacterized protein n=1 Tax=Polynucleobacter arcticus TaxID=1743165 RepID=A0A6M9PLE4_9BURK|nr:hypothetical protein DN92_03255 [Polynucleobacter arcticus]
MKIAWKRLGVMTALFPNLIFVQSINTSKICKGSGLMITPKNSYVYPSGNFCANDGEKFI